MNLDYNEAKDLISEADILLFRNPPFPSIGWWIARYTGGIHSHVGMATQVQDDWHIVEFREFKGARSVNLESQIQENPQGIDVFRVDPVVHKLILTAEKKVSKDYRKFGDSRANKITSEINRMTGKPYGMKLIPEMFMAYFMPFGRLVKKEMSDDIEPEKFVCSTAVSYAYRKHYVDLVSFVPDRFTKPADIARSPLLNYLFTLKPSEKQNE